MNLKPLPLVLGAVAVFAASSAMAATGTSSAATSFDGIATAFTDFLGNSGGAAIIIVSILIAVISLFVRPSPGIFFTTLGTGLLVGYGADAVTGFAGVTAMIPDMLPVPAQLLPPGL